MVSGKRDFTIFLILATVGLCAMSVAANVYKVGDSAGWTLRVPVDYAKWASSKNFHVGDTLLFSYNNTFHNVLQVTQEQFQSCNSSSPVASYNSGSDSIPLKRPGSFYFLCGIPGHCQVGQKVEVKVTRALSSAVTPSASPNPGPGLSPLGSPIAPTPAPGAASILHTSLLWLAVAVAVALLMLHF